MRSAGHYSQEQSDVWIVAILYPDAPLTFDVGVYTDRDAAVNGLIKTAQQEANDSEGEGVITITTLEDALTFLSEDMSWIVNLEPRTLQAQ